MRRARKGKQILYRASPGARFSHRKAQLYGEWLEELERELGHAPTTDEIWRAAKADKRCAPHDFFEWNVKQAAVAYWRTQARNLVNHIDVIIVSAGRQEAAPARVNIEDAKGITSYPAVAQVARTRFMREQLIEMAKRELEQWRRKYAL